MQGRLSPPRFGRLQSFPGKQWREEFYRAKNAGLDCIEWVYESDTLHENPLRTHDGIREIKKVTRESGVEVWSICADYFMTNPLITGDGSPDPASTGHLDWLLDQAIDLDIRYIVLPFVDASSLRHGQRIKGAVSLIRSVVKKLEDNRIELHYETDLRPVVLHSLFEEIDHPLIRANYDIGNSASLGYDPKEELSFIGEYLGSVHVKDRTLHGGSVPLGSGNADFVTCFTLFCDLHYSGPYILQAAREDGLSEQESAGKNRVFVEGLIKKISGNER